jgi:two-component system cell cycle sensor histidine kinase/response regulator CckA
VLEVRKAGERAAQLTRQLLAFSRKQVLVPRPFDINRLVAALLDRLRGILGKDVEVIFEPGAVAEAVLADPARIEEMLLHLALNARAAMPGGGRFILATATRELPPGLPPGRYAVLRLTDTGAPLAAEAQARLFEPYFSTRELGRGEGVGLAVVHGIIAQSGGRIEVASLPEPGTSFTILLPCAGEAVAAAPPSANPVPAQKTMTILIVEDETAIRGLVRATLQREGYEVLEAGGAAEAERLCRTTPGRIDLLLTDTVMPGADGRRLAERLVKVRPDMKVLLMSGFLEGEVPRFGPSREPVALLPKPFTREALVQIVREVLERR